MAQSPSHLALGIFVHDHAIEAAHRHPTVDGRAPDTRGALRHTLRRLSHPRGVLSHTLFLL